jgi:hypothetical protein
LPSHGTLQMMAKAAVVVYETVAEERDWRKEGG